MPRRRRHRRRALPRGCASNGAMLAPRHATSGGNGGALPCDALGTAALDYLDRIGAHGSLEGPPEAVFRFVDAETGERWTMQPNSGVLPWWVLSGKRRVPHTRARDYFAALALRRADPSATIAAVLNP